MEIQITDEAVEWFIDELDLDEGDVVRFFPKYGGSSDFQDGFSIGMAVESARKPQVEVEKKNVSFQIDEQDVWFFKEQDLHIGLKNDEVKYSNEPIE
ncbi:adhesin [Halalkalibacillus sediminis]|uniref:Adhesin n=1 Tax=Halalkalibacillus sediminis TaxID=2018042 RepID=A0A2I0QSB5_9BACI|nr:adhesin [Halalkalibacillus sediminis]PKR77223.1 adhesin [Halalkalibacillus sediminis]